MGLSVDMLDVLVGAVSSAVTCWLIVRRLEGRCII